MLVYKINNRERRITLVYCFNLLKNGNNKTPNPPMKPPLEPVSSNANIKIALKYRGYFKFLFNYI